MENSPSDPSAPQSIQEKIRFWYRNLPDKKRYLEFITALLSIPVLVTVIIANVNNLSHQNQTTATPTPNPTVIIREIPSSTTSANTPAETSGSPTPTQTPAAQCAKEIGPVEITSPEENQTLQANPVCIDIVRDSQKYCAVVWAYRINGSAWSDYTDKSICLYDMQPGSKRLELRVKSVVTGAETILKRNFTYGSLTPTPTTATQSASTP